VIQNWLAIGRRLLPVKPQVGQTRLSTLAGARGDLTIFDGGLAALGPGMPVVSLPLH